MPFHDLIETFTWERYSKKMAEKITRPRNAGYFTKQEAAAREMHFAEGIEGTLREGNCVHLYWLVDPSDGVVVDAKFQVFGQSALIAAAEAACELVVGKNYDQVRHIGAELLDKQMRDQPENSAFPEETLGHLNLILDALDQAVHQCQELPLPETYSSPLPRDLGSKEGGGFPEWLTFSYEQKIAILEEVLDKEVRPYVELDEGGIEIKELTGNQELIIAYQGACTSCYSAIGTTLSTIQQIVQSAVHPGITVVPSMDTLNL